MLRKKIVVVIPCSRRKRRGEVSGLKWSPRESVIAHLSPRSAGRLMASRRRLAMRFRLSEDTDLGREKPATPRSLMPARTRYDGNLYRRIDEKLWSEASDSGRVAVVIVSALYGLLTSKEAIREYNMAMDSNFAYRLPLVRWWSEQGLGSVLVEYVKRLGATVVHDFLSGSYAQIGNELSSLGKTTRIVRHVYPGLGSGSNYHRGQDVRKLLMRSL